MSPTLDWTVNSERKFSFFHLKQMIFFLISTLVSKKGSNQKIEGTLLYLLGLAGLFNIIDTFII